MEVIGGQTSEALHPSFCRNPFIHRNCRTHQMADARASARTPSKDHRRHRAAWRRCLAASTRSRNDLCSRVYYCGDKGMVSVHGMTNQVLDDLRPCVLLRRAFFLATASPCSRWSCEALHHPAQFLRLGSGCGGSHFKKAFRL
jgi:hypothetical protein